MRITGLSKRQMAPLGNSFYTKHAQFTQYRHSQWVGQGAVPPNIYGKLVIMCSENRRPKQKYCCLPKVKYFPPKVLVWLHHCYPAIYFLLACLYFLKYLIQVMLFAHFSCWVFVEWKTNVLRVISTKAFSMQVPFIVVVQSGGIVNIFARWWANAPWEAGCRHFFLLNRGVSIKYISKS